MILTGEALPVPTVPALLPGLAGWTLYRVLQTEQRHLVFLAEHLAHPVVPEGVADGIHDALAAITAAIEVQRCQLMLGGAL